MRDANDFAEEASLALTVPTIWLAAVVVCIWGRDAWEAIFRKRKKPAEWMLLGVAFSFVGQLSDNLYWGVAWFAAYIHHPGADWLFMNGVIANVFARQSVGILAAYCHIRSAFQYVIDKDLHERELLKRNSVIPGGVMGHVILSFGAGVVFWVVLLHFFKVV